MLQFSRESISIIHICQKQHLSACQVVTSELYISFTRKGLSSACHALSCDNHLKTDYLMVRIKHEYGTLELISTRPLNLPCTRLNRQTEPKVPDPARFDDENFKSIKPELASGENSGQGKVDLRDARKSEPTSNDIGKSPPNKRPLLPEGITD